MGQMLECCSPAAARASRRNRALAVWTFPLNTGIFRATGRSSIVSWARNTAPMPPSPSFFSILYRPNTPPAPGHDEAAATVGVAPGGSKLSDGLVVLPAPLTEVVAAVALAHVLVVNRIDEAHGAPAGGFHPDGPQQHLASRFQILGNPVHRPDPRAAGERGR